MQSPLGPTICFFFVLVPVLPPSASSPVLRFEACFNQLRFLAILLSHDASSTPPFLSTHPCTLIVPFSLVLGCQIGTQRRH
ncbi:hypothetical protein M408DRAFT_287700 [Serendipita vermifera MAFF 305830]|uniref:Secreted protein n=1 Tax=Serendipita vermifera MAFF 305830 TaxID=933852 RepID=A0A0C2WWU1_SERVB|nr:hypothetical protein M408DRAFT_287700 [Serendipita vermifera MAFF 305830]